MTESEMANLKFGDMIEYGGSSARGQRVMVIGHEVDRHREGTIRGVAVLHLAGPPFGGVRRHTVLTHSHTYAGLWRRIE
jgi:hypothetical protein